MPLFYSISCVCIQPRKCKLIIYWNYSACLVFTILSVFLPERIDLFCTVNFFQIWQVNGWLLMQSLILQFCHSIRNTNLIYLVDEKTSMRTTSAWHTTQMLYKACFVWFCSEKVCQDACFQPQISWTSTQNTISVVHTL